MNRTTTGLCLAALLVSCSMNRVLRADELVMRDNFFVADETRHQWVNEHNGRTGMLTVSGALLSSPCTLETNEVELPLPEQKEGIMTRYALELNLLGCGDGGAITSAGSVAGRDSMNQSTEYENIVVKQSAVLKTGKDEVLLSVWQNSGVAKKILWYGNNQITYYVNEAQYQKLVKAQTPVAVHKISDSNRRVLHLNIIYE
ncbi:TPA: nuclease PIN [Escherichia coli]|nr:nuclease PIN [Escherichia coli]HEL8550155.1 nuclease PIN [Escherichia coli]HEM0025827.1 nuclease PIN [Escherichia coli]